MAVSASFIFQERSGQKINVSRKRNNWNKGMKDHFRKTKIKRKGEKHYGSKR